MLLLSVLGGAGNGGSLDKCRRRWDLADREDLRYKFMNSFDRAMNHLDKAFGFIGAPHTCAPGVCLLCLASVGIAPSVCAISKCGAQCHL